MSNLNQTDTAKADITPTLSLSEPTGKYAVGTTNYSFVDPEREETYTEDPDDKREITAKVWYPSESVPQANTAPYISEEYSRAIATSQGISPEDFAQIVELVETNSVTNATVAEAESEYPVLIFSHGFGDLPELNSIKAEELASQGYVVVGINHTYDSIVNAFDDGRIVPLSPTFTEIEDEAQIPRLLGEGINIRAEDAQFVLDELEAIDAEDSRLLSGKLDLERTGIFGYSLGGATAAKVLAEDDRFKAGINLDGALFGDSANASLTQPFMFQNNEAFGRGGSNENLDRLNRLQQSFIENLQNDGYKITVDGTEHNNFNDIAFLSPFLVNSGVELGDLTETFAPNDDNADFEPTDPQLVNEIINSYSTAFFDRYLNSQENTLLSNNSSPYREVTFQSYPANGDDTLTGISAEDPMVGSNNSNRSTNEATSFNISIGETDILVDFPRGEDILELAKTLSLDDLEIVRGQGGNADDLLVNYESETIAVVNDIIGAEISI